MLIGHIGQDAKLTFTGEGKARLAFSLATNDNYKDREGQWKKETDWHSVVAWGPMAEDKSELMKRGKQVFVEGKIRHRTYENKEGQPRTVTEVTAWRLLPLDRSAADTSGSTESSEAPF
jgi:single-strand DNA-binding protein